MKLKQFIGSIQTFEKCRTEPCGDTVSCCELNYDIMEQLTGKAPTYKHFHRIKK